MEDVIETMLGVEIVDENDDTADLQMLAREKWQRLRKQQGIAN
jgi:CBS domain containing-hemolysin-like protein